MPRLVPPWQPMTVVAEAASGGTRVHDHVDTTIPDAALRSTFV